jgi:hypothetical protein
MTVRAPSLTVGLPVSTRVRLTLTLALRIRLPSYTTPFDEDFRGSPGACSDAAWEGVTLSW